MKKSLPPPNCGSGFFSSLERAPQQYLALCQKSVKLSLLTKDDDHLLMRHSIAVTNAVFGTRELDQIVG